MIPQSGTFDGMVPAPYKIIGYNATLYDYSRVIFPQKPAANGT